METFKDRIDALIRVGEYAGTHEYDDAQLRELVVEGLKTIIRHELQEVSSSITQKNIRP